MPLPLRVVPHTSTGFPPFLSPTGPGTTPAPQIWLLIQSSWWHRMSHLQLNLRTGDQTIMWFSIHTLMLGCSGALLVLVPHAARCLLHPVPTEHT